MPANGADRVGGTRDGGRRKFAGHVDLYARRHGREHRPQPGGEVLGRAGPLGKGHAGKRQLVPIGRGGFIARMEEAGETIQSGEGAQVEHAARRDRSGWLVAGSRVAARPASPAKRDAGAARRADVVDPDVV